ncbi:hypothetical protein LINPERPRIM_LOCUS6666, partial [Linum perenne]
VKVCANIADQPRYRNRKGEVSINVLGVCNPSAEFIYYLAGWEGSDHDGRVLRDALSRPNGLKVPKGMVKSNTEEYYNMKHSSARNVIERAFGRIVHACCLLHNFIKREVGMDDLERAYLQRAAMNSVSNVEEVEEAVSFMQPTPEWSQF